MLRYRMQTLLEMRERAEEGARLAFSEAMQALARATQEQKRLQDALERRERERKERVDAYLENLLARGADIQGMNTMYSFEARLKDEEAQVALDLEKQELAVNQAGKRVEQRRMELAEATRQLQAIEKHKEKWCRELKAERDKREELIQEESGNTRRR